MPEVRWLRWLAWGEERKRHRLWAVLAVLAAVVIAFGSLTPGDEMPRTLPWDKFNHFVGYAGLAVLSGLAGLPLVRAFIAVTLYGICIEYLQVPVPGRSGGDWADILANSLGAAAAVLLLAAIRRYWQRP
ncbi:VanZ family protein [Halomonas sp. MCCC 1A17488]|uniref:VanZ family protein n=1 Tax=Billgrantia sulfidoxydans TaxID=2733484 RepID=A0ABX7VXZ1_9GAMM|nr:MULTISPECIES: VanZ family protein [Halomonas]MCE8017115.1 VanZ family protein [Halomonas sp. MCCC 1A17488]MCG3240448.1 VanZ family protein [Halomonas sp. MCCC 1A17488]QPP49691.1 VanZ family protein [Halomonas sp. SS10-MC5]QTP53301.1 VanZ family protein [Halomonas sulfidoxydans]